MIGHSLAGDRLMSVALPIEEDPRFRRYTASAGQTVFSIPFPFQQAEDVSIQLFSDGVYTEIDRATFAITGAMNPLGGSVTFNAGRSAGDIILVVGAAILERLSSIVRDGRFASKLTDDELDRNRIIQQEQQRDINRSIKASYGLSGGELLASFPSRLLNIDGGGNIVESETPVNEKTLREQGDLAVASLIGQAGSIEVPMFDTRLAVTFAIIKPTLSVIRTGGYSVPGDAGAATYRRVSSEPTHAGKVRSLDRFTPGGAIDPFNGGWWELAEIDVAASMLNITPDGLTDVSDGLLSTGSVPGSYLTLEAGTYFIGKSLVVPTTWRFASGTKFLIADGVTVDFSNATPEIHAPKKQRFYFAGTGTGSVVGLDEVHVGWFAGDKFEQNVDASTDIQKAANAITSGGTLWWPRLWLASNGTSYISMSNGQNLKGQQRNVSRIKFLTASTKGFNWDGGASSVLCDFGAFTSNDLREPTQGAAFLYSAGRAHIATRFSVSSCYDAVITHVADCSFSAFKLNDNKRGGIRIEAKNETHINDGIIAANSGWVTLTGVTGVFSSGEPYTAPNGAKGSIWRNADGTTKMTFTTKSPQGQVITGSTTGATATVSTISLGHTAGAIVLNQRCDATVISDIEMSGGVCSVRMSAIDTGTGSLSVKVHNCLLDSNMGNCVIVDYQTDTVFSNCWFSSFVGTNNDVYASNCRGLRFVDCTWITSNAVAASFNNCRDTKVDGCIVADTNTSNTANIPALWFTNCLRCSVRGVTIGSVYGYGTGNVKSGIVNDNSDLTITDCDLSQCVTPIFTTNGGVNKISNVKGYRATNRGSVGVSFVGGQGAIAHGLNGVPTFVSAHTQGDTTNYIQVLSVTPAQIVVLGRNRTTNAAIPDGTITVVWEAATAEAA